MRVQFKASEIIKRYDNPGLGIVLNDGQTADLPDGVAKGLVKDLPQNFSLVGSRPKKEGDEAESPVVDRAIKGSTSDPKRSKVKKK